ncbi:hypothetical protein E1297_00780, partial [Roseibium sp. RKSG952]|nr:hypothetical protein [Roseibium sp. RKSG952]
DLIKQALSDCGKRPVYFKQHPDCIGLNMRPGYVDLASFPDVTEIPNCVSLADAVDNVKEIYTISSLGGFEALLRGKKVTTFGSPFYAGWGLTNDHVDLDNRENILKLEELFYIAFIKYPKYFNPHNGDQLSIDQVIEIFSKRKL